MSSAQLDCGDISVGRGTFIGGQALITGGLVEIGNCCDIAPRVVIHAGSHEIGSKTRRAGRAYFGGIKVGDGTWVGVNATIINGAIIGKGCIIAAGSMVKAGIYPENSLISGNPAVVKKILDIDQV
jgi:acetyltransferase-like isoleucine patch superfamily enzyme